MTGGFVYRGTEYAQLVGTYFAADFYSGSLYLIKNVSGSWTTNTLTGFPDWIGAFGEAENGTLYALSLRGTLYKIQGAIATPVTLVSFTGLQKNGFNELTWEARNEINVQQFEVEFSRNGTDFTQAGIVAAARATMYRFTHRQNSGGKLFYRLKILDIDGKFKYSKIIFINPTSAKTENFVKPSVIKNHYLSIEVGQPYNKVQVINLEGREVWHQDIRGRTGSLRFALPTLMPGSYLVRLLGNERVITQKVLIR